MDCELFQGDCFEVAAGWGAGCVDLVLVDPPYGTIKDSMKESAGNFKILAGCGWDVAFDVVDFLKLCSRVVRPGGRVVVFGQEPFTSGLVSAGVVDGLRFSQRGVWVKDHFANVLSVNRALVGLFEDICVFTKEVMKQGPEEVRDSPVAEFFRGLYNFYGREFLEGLFAAEGRYSSAASVRQHVKTKFGVGWRFDFLNESLYDFLAAGGVVFGRSWEDLRVEHERFKSGLVGDLDLRFPRVFNLPEGGKFRSNVFEYSKDYGGLHPTQKPVDLLRELVETYSRRGDLVADLCMGSGSTGVAALGLGRRFWGVELDAKFFGVAEARLAGLC